MKTYEEMAQAVLHRAKMHRAVRNRRIITVTASALCVCGISLAAFAASRPVAPEDPMLQVNQTTEAAPVVEDVPAVPSTSRVTFLSASADGSDAVEMRMDMAVPYRMELRVQDVRGLTKEEKEAVCEAEKEYAEALIASYPEVSDGWTWTQGVGKDAAITVISAGHIILRMDDPKQVESIHVSLAGDGQMFYLPAPDWEPSMPREYHLSDEEIERYYHKTHGGIAMSWTLDSKLTHLFDPDAPLSSYGDTITVTVSFKDGTVEIHEIDIVINDSGEIYAVYRGETAAV